MQYGQDTVDNTAYVQPSPSLSKQDNVNVSYIHTNNLSGQKTWTGAGKLSIQPCGPKCPKDLNTEIHRIHTFFGWPDNVPVTPAHLARLGFFYLGVRDKVECAFCGGVLHQWEKGDDPEVEHRRHYPHCPLMKNWATSNVPLGSGPFQTQHNLQWNNFAGHGQQQNVSAPYGRSEGVTTEPRGRQGPKHPELASEETRYSTYFRWPLYSPISPRKLAQAGFFYTYIDDQVRCFWCDGGLKDWMAGDEPWTEHARWYGEECDFVLNTKGAHYVRSIKDGFPTLVPQVEHHTSEQSWQHQYVGGVPVSMGVNQQNQNNSNDQNQYDKLFLDAMESRVVQNVLEMGFAQSDVEKVVHRQLKSNGQPFTTMTSLVESLIALEENGGNDDREPQSVELLRRKLQQMKEERTCKICMTNDACMVFIPCGHLCCCNSCANTMRKRGSTCPLCRARIRHVQRAFLS
ncbi:PREDICTED: baculoviral IAP repeat-containing protein 7-like [Branchiostoma belcheri]|uniref:RING-type E3 ubiquitin transferase n=1 Tax=Branchiostoma belcheri TaxID=7741 RepID=A0A6P4ZDQ8_BRABE|nr:PREDICTED: baculoviral IAP repeat-containing protein 7-like [Branchiostoma belcheri]